MTTTMGQARPHDQVVFFEEPRGGSQGEGPRPIKGVALTLAHKVAIIKHYEESKPMTIPKVVDWVMEISGDNLAKPPSNASISILLKKQKQNILEMYRTKQNDKVIRSKRSRRSINEAQVCCNVC